MNDITFNHEFFVPAFNPADCGYLISDSLDRFRPGLNLVKREFERSINRCFVSYLVG